MPKVEFKNPSNISAPLGLYSHIAKVPADTELFYISGQLGVRKDGSCPDNIADQADLVFANIIEILASEGMNAENIVKLQTYMVAGQDGQKVRDARIKYLGDHRPISTAIYISQLVSPEWFVEIDVIAAKTKNL